MVKKLVQIETLARLWAKSLGAVSLLALRRDRALYPGAVHVRLHRKRRASPLPATLRAVHRVDRHDVALKGVGLGHVSIVSKSVSFKLPMQKDERTDRDELTARLRKFGISDALCDRVRAEGVETVLKAPKGTKKKDPSKGATAKSDASLFTPPNLPKSKHRKSALDALSRPKMARGLLASYSGTDPEEFKYWKSVELKRRSTKETAKRESNERWTEKKRQEMRQWLAKRAELERSHKEEKAAMEKEQKAYRRDMDKYVEAKGKEDLHEHLLSESFKRERAKLKDRGW